MAPSTKDRARLERARGLRAELEILERYDRRRSELGHDYGSGQRYAELVRRRRESGAVTRASGFYSPELVHELERPLTGLELLEAYDRVGAPRVRRLELEDYRSGTPATVRSVRAWRELRRELEREGSGL